MSSGERTLKADPGTSLARRLERLQRELDRRCAAITLPRYDLAVRPASERRGVSPQGPDRYAADLHAWDRLAVALLRAFHQEHLPQAFELLYEIAAPVLARILALRLLGPWHLLSVEEIVAETFFIMYQRGATFRPRGPRAFMRWGLTIATNIIRLETRRQRRRLRREEIAAVGEEDLTANPLVALVQREDDRRRQAERNELLQVLEACFASLPEITRRCLWMAIVEGIKHRDIAGRLGLTEGAVTMRLRRARLRALAMISAEEKRRAPRASARPA
ncbi:MAG: sigma-70 family RNA polymerase sigma factor [Planctomycetota bacterium]